MRQKSLNKQEISMAETKIEWTATYNQDGTVSPGYTFNPWIGCTKVSDGCKHCYAETLMDKRYGRVKWGPQGVRVRTSEANWKKPLKWNKQAEAEGKRFKVFCASLADVFEDKPDQPELDEWRVDLFELIDKTPNLDWLLLTKRPENVSTLYNGLHLGGSETWDDWPSNVWIGTSVENQEQADKRIPELLKIPAKVRFLSMEPLLGPVDLGGHLYPDFAADDPRHFPKKNGVDWVIVGGESGHGARPMHPDWARSIRDQCQDAGVPFFFKQWGEWDLIRRTEPLTVDGKEIGELRDPRKRSDFGVLAMNGKWFHQHTGWNGRDVDTDTGEAFMVKVGKKAAGRILDGREWNESPKPVEVVT